MTSPLARAVAGVNYGIAPHVDLTAERPDWPLHYYKAQSLMATIDARLAPVLEAMAFAASVIKCGEPWTEACEKRIGAALALLRPAEAKR